MYCTSTYSICEVTSCLLNWYAMQCILLSSSSLEFMRNSLWRHMCAVICLLTAEEIVRDRKVPLWSSLIHTFLYSHFYSFCTVQIQSICKSVRICFCFIRKNCSIYNFSARSHRSEILGGGVRRGLGASREHGHFAGALRGHGRGRRGPHGRDRDEGSQPSRVHMLCFCILHYFMLHYTDRLI